MSKNIQGSRELRPIPNFPNYLISAEGKVYSSKRRGRWLRPGTTRGYLRVCLSKDGRKYNCSVHRLVLETFVGSCPPGHEGCHNDGVPAHNWLGNLRWGTKSENKQDAIKHGTAARGEQNGRAKHTESIVILIRQLWSIHWMGITQPELADMFGVSRSNVGDILRRKIWKHI